MFLGVLFGSLNTFGYAYFGFIFGFVLGSVPAFIISHLILYKGFNKLLKTSIPLGALIVVTVVGMGLLNYDVIGYNTYVPNSENVVSAGFIESSNCYFDEDENLGSVTRKSAEDYTDKDDINEIIRLHNQYLIGTGDVVNASNKKFENIWYNILIADTFNALNGNDAYCFAYKLDNG
jgi:ABC-2 type transport system permease protein